MGNSVIYRPAYDAEVEYLESDGNSYIDTGLKASSELGILAHIQNSKNTQTLLFGGANDFFINELCFCSAPNNGVQHSYFRFGGDSSDKVDALTEYAIYDFDNTQAHCVMNVGSLVYSNYRDYYYFVSDYNFYLFGENLAGHCIVGSGVRIYDFKIYQNSTLVRDFIPVRVGSTGYMYDKVSKQLFANKGTGQFILGNDVSNAVIPQQRCVLYFGNQRSVGFERIYEEYEWLVGDGTAYILHPNTDEFEIKINSSGYCAYEKGDWKNHGTMYSVMEFSHTDNIGWYSSLRVSAKAGGTRSVYRTNGIALGEHIIKKTAISNAIGVFTDGVRHFKNATTDVDYVGSDLIFYQLQPNSVCGVAYLTCSQFSFTPVKLLQSIPAILDGNGIARQAGECGMWDKVSGRFFGNVASSGTFKAVNLAEGVDYEVYDWLVGDGTAYISGITYNLWDNHLVSQIYNMNKNYRQFVQSDINLNDRNISMTRNSIYLQIIFRESSQTNITHIADLNPNDFSGAIDFDYYISDSNFNVKVNGVTYTNATSVYATESKWNSFDGLLIYSEKMSYIREITPSGIYVSNLIPVKLLKPLPSKYDANGISRNANECGMYDTVNDVFYGNVASSGTFTVSND